MIAWFRRIDELVADAPVSCLVLTAAVLGAGFVVVVVLLIGLARP